MVGGCSGLTLGTLYYTRLVGSFTAGTANVIGTPYSATSTFTTATVSQTISFAPPGNTLVSAGTVAVAATASSGLPVVSPRPLRWCVPCRGRW